MINQYFYLLFLGMICLNVGCNSPKNVVPNNVRTQNEIFSIESSCIFKLGNGVDSQVGTVICDDITFEYDYGKFSHQGPITLEEDFANGFKGNFYAKFFELIHIDSKVHRMFLDSVRIINVKKPSQNDRPLFACTACNAVATLVFRNRTYQYPYTNDPLLWSNKDYKIIIDTIDGYKRKCYISAIDSLPSGLYIRPLVNPKNSNKLSITTKQKHPKVHKLLASIRLL